RLINRRKSESKNGNSNPQNDGEYTIVSVNASGGTTTIEVAEAIPGPLQTGDNLNLTVKVDCEFDYTNNKVVLKNKDYTSVSAFVPTEQLDFHSRYQFVSSYVIDTVQYVPPHTEIAFTATTKKVGYAALAETGLLLEADAATGGPYDDDRVFYYASPQGYFSKHGTATVASFANKGGNSDLSSVLDALQKMMPGVAIDPTTLKPSGGSDVLSFAYSSTSKAKTMLYLMGLTKTEVQGMSLGSISNSHITMYKLKKLGGSKTDANGVTYDEYEVILAGMNASLSYTESPTGISVFTTDNLIFVSQAFAAKYGIDTAIAAQALDDFIAAVGDPAGPGSDLGDLPNKTHEEIKNLKS
ncbi:MAG: hypothetical protein AAF570_28870, partial [Bacteroidota bacterium]